MSYCNRCGIPHTPRPCLREEDQPVGEYPELPTGFTLKPAIDNIINKLYKLFT